MTSLTLPKPPLLKRWQRYIAPVVWCVGTMSADLRLRYAPTSCWLSVGRKQTSPQIGMDDFSTLVADMSHSPWMVRHSRHTMHDKVAIKVLSTSGRDYSTSSYNLSSDLHVEYTEEE